MPKTDLEDRPANEPTDPSRAATRHQRDPTLTRARAGSGAREPAKAAAGGSLPAGSLLADRFRIERFLGRGGMGEVYEASDLELSSRVALKALRREIATEPQMLERFRREIQLSRQVTHPNVCRLFDLFRHRDEESGEELYFLTMELLEGETLAEHVARRGALAPAQALPLAHQMAAGLAAAHANGVVHRDFKSSNVMLIPADGAPRAVITDFGLARTAVLDTGAGTSPAPAVQLTARSEVIGTLAYMAPEQLEKREITPAVDVYAFGVVLFEMLTGSLPFEGGDDPLSAAFRRLREEPPSPRRRAADLDTRWDELVRRCLQVRPERRPADAGAVASELARWGDRHRWWRRPAGLAAALALMVTLALAAVHFFSLVEPPRSASQPSMVAAGSVRRSIAVLDFDNLLGRPEAGWLAAALPEMLTTELAAGAELRVIPRDNVVRMARELELGEKAALDPEYRERVRRYLGADLLVLGSYAALGDSGDGQLRLDLQVHDARGQEEPIFVAETGSEARLFDLLSQTGSHLRSALGVGRLDAEERRALAATRPASAEAARLYSEGLAALRRLDTQEARDLLRRSLELDPHYPLAWVELASAWRQLGYDTEARRAAERAHDLRAGLSREESLRVEGVYRETVQDWPGAIEIFASLWQFFPDNLEHGLALAAAEVRAGRGTEALETVAEMRRLPPPTRDDPRTDLAEARAAGSLSDLERQLDAARRAVEKAEAVGAGQLLIEGSMAEAAAQRQRGDWQAAAAAVERAEETARQLGHRRGVADAFKEKGVLAWSQGDVAATEAASRRAAEIYGEIGDRRNLARSRNNVAMVLDLRGQQAEAEAIYRQALADARAVDDPQAISAILLNLAVIAHGRGDLEAARRGFEEALVIKRRIGERATELLALGALGIVASDVGEMETARAYLSESLKIAREIGDRLAVARFLLSLAGVEVSAGELGAALGRAQEALRLARELTSRSAEAEALVDLARLHTLRGELEVARQRAREALEIADAEGNQGEVSEILALLSSLARTDGRNAQALGYARRAVETSDDLSSEVTALVALSLARLSAGEVGGAVASLRRAEERLEGSELRLLQLEVVVAGAPARLEAEPASGVREGLERALAECRRRGLVELAFEAELALGVLPLGAANPHAEPAALEELAQRAETAGFGLVARRARAAVPVVPVG